MKVKKNGVVMVVRDEHKLAAFVNNGWEKVAEKESATNQRKETAK